MIRTKLDSPTRDRLQALRRNALPPKVRARIAMITPSDAGWSAPRIAAHIGYCGQAVRDLLKDSLARGADALYPRRSGPAPDAARRDRVAGGLRRLLTEDRTWTSRQLGVALARRGIVLGAGQVRRHLKRGGARYRRTVSSLEHKQDPAEAERAGRVLGNLKAKAAAGELRLYYPDECGFAPTLPVGSSWGPPGPRKLTRYEAPQGRRVNALAAYCPTGRSRGLEVFTAERTRDAYDLPGSLKALPWAKAPRVAVLDDASIHTSGVVRRARRALAERGTSLYYVPPYSPELDRIEAVFRQVKYQGMPQRSFTTRSGLREAVERGFSEHAQRLRAKCSKQLRPAA